MQKKSGRTGRPSGFSQSLAFRILELAKAGKTDAEIATAVGISLTTLKNWKGNYEDFSSALKKAKSVADQLVEASLFQRAVGYTHRAVKFFQHEGMILSEEFDQHHPPDVTACIFWLKNRRPNR